MTKRGFTLIEVAITLVLLGLLIGLGSSLVGPLTKQTKVIDSREAVKGAKAALTGYAVKNGFLPATVSPSGARALDAWGNPLSYYVATSLNGSGNACNFITTDRTVFECIGDGTTTPCPTSNQKSNIAFIVYSNGHDADGAGTTTQPTAGPVCPSGTCYWIRAQNSSDASATLPYDDIVQYATLDEIRNAIGCQFKIVNKTLPDAMTGQAYSNTLTPSGGTSPYTWSTGQAQGSCAAGNVRIWSSDIGICLNTTSGIISGTPNTPGSYYFTATLQDANSLTTSSVFTINVIDSCLTKGMQVTDTLGNRWYRRSGGACTAATTNNGITVYPGDTMTFFTNNTCTTGTCTTQTLTYGFFQNYDTNDNCAVSWTGAGPPCTFTDL